MMQNAAKNAAKRSIFCSKTQNAAKYRPTRTHTHIMLRNAALAKSCVFCCVLLRSAFCLGRICKKKRSKAQQKKCCVLAAFRKIGQKRSKQQNAAKTKKRRTAVLGLVL